ncbi:MAG: alcohol dehydrogenase [Rhodospirillales bacterium]|jgi:hypothetical protein|nr:alcohol dehydrogenase [Rhodospirillales bacterium]
MKAIVLKEFGGPENLSLDDLPIPSVEPGTVLIRAVAASANPADVSISKGTPFSPALPAVLGCDVAGVVESVGDGVTGFAPGDEVVRLRGRCPRLGRDVSRIRAGRRQAIGAETTDAVHATGGGVAARRDHRTGRDRSRRGFVGASCLDPRGDRRRRSCRRTDRRGARREGRHHDLHEIARNGHAHRRHGRNRLPGRNCGSLRGASYPGRRLRRRIRHNRWAAQSEKNT